MTNTFYDDFKAMTAERMAGSMEDMTYAYEQTRVPKAHYRKMLSTVADHIEQAVQCMVNMIYRHGNHLRLEDHTGNSCTSTSMGVLGHKKLLE